MAISIGPGARNLDGSWRHRRRIIYGTLIFCAFCVLYLMFFGTQESALHETIANAAFFLAGGVIGSYVFGAVWDDSNFASILNRGAPAPTSGTDEPISGTGNVDNPGQ